MEDINTYSTDFLAEPLINEFKNKHDNRNYTTQYKFNENKSLVIFKISDDSLTHYYEKIFNHLSLLSEDKSWGILGTTENVVDYLNEEMLNSKIEFTNNGLCINLIQKIGKKEHIFKFECEMKKIDTATTITSLNKSVKDVKDDLEKMSEKLYGTNIAIENISTSIGKLQDIVLRVEDKLNSQDKNMNFLETKVNDLAKQQAIENEKIWRKFSDFEKILNDNKRIESIKLIEKEKAFNEAKKINEKVRFSLSKKGVNIIKKVIMR